jgi:hypothetical protein
MPHIVATPTVLCGCCAVIPHHALALTHMLARRPALPHMPPRRSMFAQPPRFAALPGQAAGNGHGAGGAYVSLGGGERELQLVAAEVRLEGARAGV